MPQASSSKKIPSKCLSKSPSLDVVIVNYHSYAELRSCVGSLRRCLSECANIWVEDNSIGLQPPDWIQEDERIRLTCHNKNLGFGRAANLGMARGQSEFILLLNPDTEIINFSMNDIAGYLDKNQNVGILGPVIEDLDGQIQGSARAFHSLSTAFFGRQSILSKLYPNNPFTRRNVMALEGAGGTKEVDWVSGAAMFIRRKALQQVGGFDPRFFLYFEDTDLCRQMWENGWRVLYGGVCRFRHQIGASGSGHLRPVIEFHKSCYRYLQKYTFDHRPWLAPIALWALSLRLVAVVTWENVKSIVKKSRR